MAREGVTHIFHYLDDFVVLGPPNSSVCQDHLDTLMKVCEVLRVPLAAEKKEGPSSVIVFLGIVIDTVKQELRLPEEKLRRLQQIVGEWVRKKSCIRYELESLIGTLHHACKVIN